MTENEAVLLLKNLGWDLKPPGEVKFGCHLELPTMPDDFEPDGCVIDSGNRNDCIYAKRIACKEQCEYWKRITPESIRKARGE